MKKFVCSAVVILCLIATHTANAQHERNHLAANPTAPATNSFASDVPIFNELSFYVCAHQDDWQLLMGKNAQDDISNFHERTDSNDPTPTSGGKVVFIYTTAGDAPGLGISPYIRPADPYPYANRNVPYYRIREVGAINSINLAANRAGGSWAFEPYPLEGFVTINGHNIYRYSYRNTVSYFMRVSSSSFDDMAGSEIKRGVTVDNSTTYNNWCDFTQTIGAIYSTERNTTSSPANITPWLNIPDYDTSINIGEHPQHLLTSKAALQAANSLAWCLPTALYIGYHSKNLGYNLSVPDTQNEAGLVAVYCMALIDYRIWAEWISDDQGYQKLTACNWYRVINSCNVSIGNCTLGGNFTPNAKRNESIDSQKSMPQVFPNPVGQVLTIQSEKGYSLLNIRLVDMAGKEILQIDGKRKNDIQINVTGFYAGVHNLIITQITPEGIKLTTTKKVVIEPSH